MDEVDRKLVMLMAANPRMHYRDLAGRVGISRQAAHQRVRALVKSGVIKGTTAGISFPYLDAVSVSIFGKCVQTLTEDVFDRLCGSELTRRAIIASDNYLYVVGELRGISELDGYVRFVKRAARMLEPTVGIFCVDEELMPRYPVDGGGRRVSGHKRLSALDLKIISALRDDARRPLAGIAEATGVSAKTVKRHLDEMIAEGALDLHLLADVPTGGDMLFMMRIGLEDGADRLKVGRRLLRICEPLDSYGRTFSNLPGLLIIVFWTGDVLQVRRVLRESYGEEGVGTVMLNFCYFERIYRTWRDGIPSSSMGPARVHRGSVPTDTGDLDRAMVGTLSRVA